MIKKEDVYKAARLAYLQVEEEELELYTNQLRDILNFANTLQTLPTKEVEPMAHVLPLKNVTRPDAVKPSLPLKTVMQNVPEWEEGFFSVPSFRDRS